MVNSPFGNRPMGNGDREEICNQSFPYTSMDYVCITHLPVFLIYKQKTCGGRVAQEDREERRNG